MEIPFHEKLPDLTTFDMIIDAIFGFSFAGDIREPFLSIIQVIIIIALIILIIKNVKQNDVNRIDNGKIWSADCID